MIEASAVRWCREAAWLTLPASVETVEPLSVFVRTEFGIRSSIGTRPRRKPIIAVAAFSHFGPVGKRLGKLQPESIT